MVWDNGIVYDKGEKPRAKAVVFKQIRDGDIRKMAAQSHDAQTGGGARDLRFPADPFISVLKLFFPVVSGHSDNGGEIREGLLYSVSNGSNAPFVVQLHPPTNARPSEVRIAKIHELEPLQNHPDVDERIPLFLIMTLGESGMFRCDFASADDLHNEWHEEVSGPILRSLDVVSGQKSACGYIDFERGTEYLHR